MFISTFNIFPRQGAPRSIHARITKRVMAVRYTASFGFLSFYWNVIWELSVSFSFRFDSVCYCPFPARQCWKRIFFSPWGWSMVTFCATVAFLSLWRNSSTIADTTSSIKNLREALDSWKSRKIRFLAYWKIPQQSVAQSFTECWQPLNVRSKTHSFVETFHRKEN